MRKQLDRCGKSYRYQHSCHSYSLMVDRIAGILCSFFDFRNTSKGSFGFVSIVLTGKTIVYGTSGISSFGFSFVITFMKFSHCKFFHLEGNKIFSFQSSHLSYLKKVELEAVASRAEKMVTMDYIIP